MNKDAKIFVAGHQGLLGSAILRQLVELGHTNVITVDRATLDLRDQHKVDIWFEQQRPEYVFLAAAQVFGIGAKVSGEVILNNLRIEINVIDAARRNGCKKLLFPGSNCVYPKFSKLPITEDQILTGVLEPSSESYAVAKIAGITMCQHFRKQWDFNAITVMPCNLYGPNDTFNLDHAHVMPSMINKIVTAKKNNAKSVTFWGDGSARREFLYADDIADACILCMQSYNDAEPINLASNEEVSLSTLAEKIKHLVGYTGAIEWDSTKPVGTHAKTLDISKIKKLGWQPTYSLDQGISKTIDWFEGNFGD
jgi:GDP-L-fucose synthase